MKAYSINVFGKVQGVGFRYYTKLKAEELEVCGTVENRPDGSVLIFADFFACFLRDLNPFRARMSLSKITLMAASSLSAVVRRQALPAGRKTMFKITLIF